MNKEQIIEALGGKPAEPSAKTETVTLRCSDEIAEAALDNDGRKAFENVTEHLSGDIPVRMAWIAEVFKGGVVYLATSLAFINGEFTPSIIHHGFAFNKRGYMFYSIIVGLHGVGVGNALKNEMRLNEWKDEPYSISAVTKVAKNYIERLRDKVPTSKVQNDDLVADEILAACKKVEEASK